MNKNVPKKLTLRRETILSLSSAELDEAYGGTGSVLTISIRACDKLGPIIAGATAGLEKIGQAITVTACPPGARQGHSNHVGCIGRVPVPRRK